MIKFGKLGVSVKRMASIPQSITRQYGHMRRETLPEGSTLKPRRKQRNTQIVYENAQRLTTERMEHDNWNTLTEKKLANRKKKKNGKRSVWVHPPGLSKEKQREMASKTGLSGTQPFVVHPITKQCLDIIDHVLSLDSISQHDLESVIDAYRNMKSIHSVKTLENVLTIFIKYQNATLLGESIQLFQDLKTQNLTPSHKIFKLLIAMCVRANHPSRALYVLKEYEKRYPVAKILEKGAELYPIVLKLSIANNFIESARLLTEKMLDMGILQATNEGATSSETVTQKIAEFSRENQLQDVSLAVKSLSSPFFDSAAPTMESSEIVADVEAPQDTIEAFLFDTLRDYFNVGTEASRVNDTLENKVRSRVRYLRALHHDVEKANTFDLMEPIRHKATLTSLKNPSVKDEDHVGYGHSDKRYMRILDEAYLDFVRVFNGTISKDRGDTDREFAQFFGSALHSKRRDPLAIELANARERLSEPLRNENRVASKALHDIAMNDYNKVQLSAQRKAAGEYNWVPVIIYKNFPRYVPKSLDVNEITRETVLAAKREFMNHIKDTYNYDVNKRKVTIQWYDRTTNKFMKNYKY